MLKFNFVEATEKSKLEWSTLGHSTLIDISSVLKNIFKVKRGSLLLARGVKIVYIKTEKVVKC